MNIIHSCTSKSFSGLEQYALDLVSWQHQAGKFVRLFCRENSTLAKQAQARGVPVWLIGENENYGIRLWKKMSKVWGALPNDEGSTLHMHAGGEPWFHLPWLLKRPRQLSKTILHYHIWINHWKKDPLHYFLFRGIDEVWSSSETARAQLAHLLPVSRKKLRIVSYGRDVAALQNIPKQQWRQEVRESYGISQTACLGVCVSRIEPIKGIQELFDAFVSIAQKNPLAHFILVGEASPENKKSEQFARQLQQAHRNLPLEIQNRFHLPGYDSEYLRILAAADFYVLPSYEECLSLVLLDALILGLPIIGTSAGGTPSIVRPHETGMLVPPRNVEALAKAMAQFYENPLLCTRLSQGAQKLGQDFECNFIFREILNWYS